MLSAVILDGISTMDIGRGSALGMEIGALYLVREIRLGL
jgi:hypothetical protein